MNTLHSPFHADREARLLCWQNNNAEMLNQLNNPQHPDFESEMGSALRGTLRRTANLHDRVNQSRSELNNSQHWREFQQIEKDYQESMHRELGTQNLPHIVAALQRGDNRMMNHVRAFKDSFCARINAGLAQRNINWRVGAGLDTDLNFDAQRGTSYTELSPSDKNLLNTVYLPLYNSQLAAYVQQFGQQYGRPPNMNQILRWKINWCQTANAELDNPEHPNYNRTQCRFYEGTAWSPRIAVANDGNVSLARGTGSGSATEQPLGAAPGPAMNSLLQYGIAAVDGAQKAAAELNKKNIESVRKGIDAALKGAINRAYREDIDMDTTILGNIATWARGLNRASTGAALVLPQTVQDAMATATSQQVGVLMDYLQQIGTGLRPIGIQSVRRNNATGAEEISFERIPSSTES